MIHCFLVLCLISNPDICQPEMEIFPDTHEAITSPMQCARGGFITYAQDRIAEPGNTPTQPIWFPKTISRLEGDGAEIIKGYLAEEARKRVALEPQVK